MPRKKKATTEPVATEAEAITQPEAAIAEDIIQTAEIAEMPKAEPLPASLATSHAPEIPAEATKTWAPSGPRWSRTERLSNERDGPKMRLGRDNRFNQMAIAFDVKPAEEIRERLHDAGWKWRQAESQWTKQLDDENRATSHQDAERFFDELLRLERKDRNVSETPGAVRH